MLVQTVKSLTCLYFCGVNTYPLGGQFNTYRGSWTVVSCLDLLFCFSDIVFFHHAKVRNLLALSVLFMKEWCY